VSIGRLGPSKDHFVVAWDATIVEEDVFLGTTSYPYIGNVTDVRSEPAEPEFEPEPHRK